MLGSNCMNLLAGAPGSDLKDRVFSRCQIPKAYFYQRNLSGSDFSMSNLSECELRGADISNCKFKNANCKNINLNHLKK